MKRLFLLLGLVLTIATPTLAQTQTDTIRFNSSQISCSFSEKVKSGIEIEWISEDGTSNRLKPDENGFISNENGRYEQDMPSNGQVCIYYTYNSSTSSYTINMLPWGSSSDIHIYRHGDTINVSGCKALTELSCYENYNITSINASGCTSLQYLSWSGGAGDGLLKMLDIRGCTALKRLSCLRGQLISLDISDCIALESLDCTGNQLTKLDVSNCIALESLDCSGNQLTSLDLSNCSVLKDLDCSENRIPLSMIYDWSKINDSISISASEQSDSITLRINQPLDLSSERLLGEILSTFESSAYHQTLTSDYWKENNFIFRFLKPLQYTLTLYNSGVNQRQEYDNDDYYSYEDASFTWYITVIDEVQEGFFNVKVATNNPEWGTATITGDGTYEEGANVTITAKAKDGYRFANWTDGEDVFSTEAVHSFTVTENLELVANFEKIPDDVANENRKNDNFAVYVQDRMIRLSENRGTVQVFNTAGQCIYKGSSTRIPVPHSGVYIVKIGTKNYKVVVR